MSTILKALRRLEEQKAAASEQRPLREEVASWDSPSPDPPAFRSWLPATLALVVGLVGGGVAFWMVHGASPWERAGDAQVAAVPAPPPARSVAAGPAPVPRPAPAAVAADPAPSVAAPPDTPFASEVEVVRRPRAAPRVADAEPIELPQAGSEQPGALRPVDRSPAVAKARREAFEALQRARTAAAEATPAPQPTVRAASPPAPAPAPAVQPEAREPAPVRAEAPPAPPPEPAPRQVVEPAPVEPPPAPEIARTAPVEETPAADAQAPVVVRVERTEWHPLPERRSAWLAVGAEGASRRVSEGDVVEGLLVSKIEPSGVLFDRDGETLRRAVGAD